MSFRFCVIWLKVVSLVFAVFGVALAVFSQTKLFDLLFNNQINPVFFGDMALSMDTIRFQQWIYGLLGATCFMVGIMIFFIVSNAFEAQERWALKGISFSLVGWFVIDQPISIYFGVYFNAIFNLCLLIAFAVPLIAAFKYFKKNEP